MSALTLALCLVNGLALAPRTQADPADRKTTDEDLVLDEAELDEGVEETVEESATEADGVEDSIRALSGDDDDRPAKKNGRAAKKKAKKPDAEATDASTPVTTDVAAGAAEAKPATDARLVDEKPVAKEPRFFDFFLTLKEQGFEDPLDTFDSYTFTPLATVIGGGHYEIIHHRTDIDDTREGRFTTVAMARAGFVATLGSYFSIESEVEMNAGPYGTSVWEGQAALQVRNQLLRFEAPGLVYADKLRVDVGRVTDDASLNYFAPHVANMLLSDDIARRPLLHAGFNRGNGIVVRYSLFDIVTLGATVNAGNPTSSTGTLMVGGTFPPFARFYEVPHANVGRDAKSYPLSTFHAILAAPSLQLHWGPVRAQTELQLVQANTNTTITTDENIRAFNLRGGVELTAFNDLLWDNGMTVFANLSRVQNDVVDPKDSSKLREDPYEGIVASGGINVDVWKRSGFGIETAMVREVEPDAAPQMTLFVNGGATWWATKTIALSGRVAHVRACVDLDCNIDGATSAYVTLRAQLGPQSKDQP
jgi:hypothetical protein